MSDANDFKEFRRWWEPAVPESERKLGAAATLGAPATKKNSFMRCLFDMSFSSFATPSIARVLYVVFLVLDGLGLVFSLTIIGSISDRIGGGWTVLYVLYSLLAALLGALGARVITEVLVDFFAIVDNLKRLVERPIQEEGLFVDPRGGVPDIPRR